MAAEFFVIDREISEIPGAYGSRFSRLPHSALLVMHC